MSASVAGILTAAQQVLLGIDMVLSCRKNGSKDVRAVRKTVDTLRAVLLQLQLILISRAKTLDPQRASLIMAEEVVATLSACVLTFSDLDDCVKGLVTDERLGWLDSVRWAMRMSDLKTCLKNLEAQKASLSLILNILTWYISRFCIESTTLIFS